MTTPMPWITICWLQHLSPADAGDAVNIPSTPYTEHARMSDVTVFARRAASSFWKDITADRQPLRRLMDASIFMDTLDDICLLRRLVRDVQERGRTMDSVLKRYRRRCVPCSCSSSTRPNGMPT